MTKETKTQPPTGDDRDRMRQVMSREPTERFLFKEFQTCIFSQNIYRTEAADSHLAGSIKRVYVTLQKDKHLFKNKLLFLTNTQANQALSSQTKNLHAVSCEFSWWCKAPQGTKQLWYFLRWLSTSICWGFEKQRRHEAQEDLNNN